jgi:hypothetical protein
MRPISEFIDIRIRLGAGLISLQKNPGKLLCLSRGVEG